MRRLLPLRLRLDEAVALHRGGTLSRRRPRSRGRLGGHRNLPTLRLHHPVQIEEID